MPMKLVSPVTSSCLEDPFSLDQTPTRLSGEYEVEGGTSPRFSNIDIRRPTAFMELSVGLYSSSNSEFSPSGRARSLFLCVDFSSGEYGSKEESAKLILITQGISAIGEKYNLDSVLNGVLGPADPICAVGGTPVSPRFSDGCSSLVCLLVCRARNVCFTSVLGWMLVVGVPCSVTCVFQSVESLSYLGDSGIRVAIGRQLLNS
uniref:Uncharacterized protein n=1 Tax=Timema monikensis TaxID=170555 RepID=A0A7R9EI52_9NEOP|nr:unnamed protein product [Timema monikensis]